MILVDTSIWIDHLSRGDAHLADLLRGGEVLGHPWVRGELSLGNLAHRDEVLGLIQNLPQAVVATDAEMMILIDRQQLFGLGIGYVDAQLLAATRLSDGARLWTRDKRLRAAALQLELTHDDPHGS